MRWEPVIGLEVHVQLATATKIFCGCENRFGAEPNTLVCPVCLGYPGALPVLNRRAVDLALNLALALSCEVPPTSVFARKNYFYADLPKGYQLSQFERPLAVSGKLPLGDHDREIGIDRLHLEEDAGKLLHEAPGGGALPGSSLVDFNRCGVPLVEIVSAPEIASASEAQDYLQTLHQVLLYTGTSDGNMEEGSLRCDANVSVRRTGSSGLGTKAEVKNLNSFRNVARAIEFEIDRQIGRLESGSTVVQETRTFDAAQGVTRPLRSKEEAHDYRYFPEPDLPPLVLAPERVERLRASLPELPWQARRRLVESYGLTAEDARLMSSSVDLSSYFEAAVAAHPGNAKGIANWVMTEVLRELKSFEGPVAEALAPESLARLVELVDEGSLSGSAAKEVFQALWETEDTPDQVMRRLGLEQIRDADEIGEWIGEVLADHPGPVDEFLGGKTKALGFLVGQVMKRSRGRADPRQTREMLQESLDRLQAERV